MPVVEVPAARLARWVDNFVVRHGESQLKVNDGAVHGDAPDGSHFSVALPFGARHDGGATVEALLAAARPPASWGVLLVRKGGFAVAKLEGDSIVASKVGRRHVQGRSKAGGQSQQRFARRRDNQARQAYEAAADHAARVLEGIAGPLVIGGDRSALVEALAHPSLRGLTTRDLNGEVPEPRRATLEAAIEQAQCFVVTVHNA